MQNENRMDISSVNANANVSANASEAMKFGINYDGLSLEQLKRLFNVSMFATITASITIITIAIYSLVAPYTGVEIGMIRVYSSLAILQITYFVCKFNDMNGLKVDTHWKIF